MPTNKNSYNTPYQKEYRKKSGKLDDMAQRQRARRAAQKAGKVSPNDGKEVDHINGTKGGNGASNIRVVPKEVNRAGGAKKAIKARKARMKNGGKY